VLTLSCACYVRTSGEVDGMKSVGGSAEPSSRGADGQPVYTMEHMLPILRRCVYRMTQCDLCIFTS
jgi:hypothetical protein